jgi:hypothetical protein
VATAERPAIAAAGGTPRVATRAWEDRLYDGLRVACVPPPVREALAAALGAAGVEAEFFLLLARDLGAFPGPQPHARGEALLLQLDAAARRIVGVGAALEVATQAYLTALEAGYPDLRAEADAADPWWPPFAGYALEGDPAELRLRRCGYAYRHVVAAHLGPALEGVAEQMALTLHALRTLPPAGIAPASALHAGLYELSSSLQGYAIPTHIASHAEERPGLLAAVARLAALDAAEDTSLAADIAWAQAQYQAARRVQLAALGGDARSDGARRWATRGMRDWQDVIAALEAVRLRERALR